MNELQQALTLITLAFISNLFLRCMWNIISLFATGRWHSNISSPRWNNRGEVSTSTDAEVRFDEKQQQAVDKIVQDRLARERAKFGDYEDLRKFKTEYEKSQEQKNQEELVRQKKYEEAENGYKTKINEFGQKLSAKDQEIQNLRIEHSLTNEVSKQNGYTEEVIALIKNQAVLDSNGQVMIKTKDANGLDTQVPVADGIKKFLTDRPHLVRSSHKQGSGTGGGGNGTSTGESTGSGQGDDLNSLNAQLQEAMRGTDLKRISDIKQKIKAKRAF